MGKHRLELEFNADAWKILEELQTETGETKPEIIRQALILLHYYHQVKKEGKKMYLFKDGQVEEEINL